MEFLFQKVLSAIAASPTVAMEIGNEEIDIDGMVDHVAGLALEIRNYALTQGQRSSTRNPVTTLSEGLGRRRGLACRSRRHELWLAPESSLRRAASRIFRWFSQAPFSWFCE
jgi:hypothetical protein